MKRRMLSPTSGTLIRQLLSSPTNTQKNLNYPLGSSKKATFKQGNSNEKVRQSPIQNDIYFNPGILSSHTSAEQ